MSPDRRIREENYQLLIRSAVELLGKHKFKEVTARKVAAHAKVDPKVIRRLFGSYESLLIAVYHELRTKGGLALSKNLSTFESSKKSRADGVDLKTRLAAWLISTGTPAERFFFGDKNMSFEISVWESVFNERISERTKKAFVALAYTSSTGHTIFGPLVEGLSPEISEDGFSLLTYMIKNLEKIQKELGLEK
jgi:AcrR family transcriptional regulator